LIKYIKRVLWRAAKRLSYTEDAQWLKSQFAVERIFFFFLLKAAFAMAKLGLISPVHRASFVITLPKLVTQYIPCYTVVLDLSQRVLGTVALRFSLL